jgi:ChaB
MPKIRRRGLAQGGELPGTLKRSSKEAQETFTKARDSAVRTYGEGDQADRAAYADFKRKFEKRGDHWIPKRSADSGELALTSLGAVPSIRRRPPPCMRWRGPRLVPGRPDRLTGRLAPGPPAGAAHPREPPVSRRLPRPFGHLRMMPVSNGKSILTGPGGRPQGSAGIHFRFFRRPHFIHRRCLVIRIIRCLSTGLCTVRPQVPWITSEIAVRSTFRRARHRRDERRRCTAAARARICR